MFQIIQEVRTCVEQLQTLEREVKNLANTEKQLADARDRQDQKAMEKETLLLKKEVYTFPPIISSPSLNTHLT
jgi:kinetochore protein Nuf2